MRIENICLLYEVFVIETEIGRKSTVLMRYYFSVIYVDISSNKTLKHKLLLNSLKKEEKSHTNRHSINNKWICQTILFNLVGTQPEQVIVVLFSRVTCGTLLVITVSGACYSNRFIHMFPSNFNEFAVNLYVGLPKHQSTTLQTSSIYSRLPTTFVCIIVSA